jgi:cytochrome b involved in lipid metabolism
MRSSCRQYVEALEQRPPLEGQLSLASGFLPLAPTRSELPASHRIWDELAAELPQLFFSNATQRVLSNLPRLSVAEDELADEDVTRASVVLSALAHAYWRFGVDRFFPQRITQVPTELPASISLPWRELSRRLGRHRPEQPFQNFYDLFLANYRYAPHAGRGSPLTIENLELLVPSFGNEAERVFYLSFVEMHHHFTPVVAAVCELDDGVREGDVERVLGALHGVRESFRRATTVWNKISARRGSAVYCDPVLWSKTAAILGVPPDGCVQGATSGACAPVLYLMDALLGRDDYASRYGQFMLQQARELVAPTVHELSLRVRAIPLAEFIARRAGSAEGTALHEARLAMIESYSGKESWLGRHAAKVFNYLCVSTITGRNASVSGHERYFSRQTWIEASLELHESRAERSATAGGCPMGHGLRPHAPAPGAAEQHLPAPELPLYSRVEVARHQRTADLWLIIGERVYDVSRYVDKHPGGRALLQAHAGQDVTQVFRSLTVHQAPTIERILSGLVIGRVLPEDLRHERLRQVLYMLSSCQQALVMQYEHPMQTPALKLFSDENAHMMLWRENLPAAYELLESGGWRRISEDSAVKEMLVEAQDLSRSHDWRGELNPQLRRLIELRCESLHRHDLGLLERLFELAAQALNDAGERPEDGPRVADRCSELARAMHCEILAQTRARPAASDCRAASPRVADTAKI